MGVGYEWCMYLSICTRIKICKSRETFVWSPKGEHFWSLLRLAVKMHVLIFSNFKYLHVTIASLANVNPVSLLVQFINGKCLALYSLYWLKKTSMITVSTCGVKLQEGPLGHGKKAKTLNLHGYLLYSLYKMTVAIYKKIAKKLSIATLWKFTMSSQFLPLTSYSSPSTPSPFVYYSQSVILTMNSQMEQFPSIYKQASMQD